MPRTVSHTGVGAADPYTLVGSEVAKLTQHEYPPSSLQYYRFRRERGGKLIIMPSDKSFMMTWWRETDECPTLFKSWPTLFKSWLFAFSVVDLSIDCNFFVMSMLRVWICPKPNYSVCRSGSDLTCIFQVSKTVFSNRFDLNISTVRMSSVS